MRKETARNFCLSCITQIIRCGTDSYIEHPAIAFNERVKCGEFNALSEEEFKARVAEIEELAELFNNRRSRTAGSILMDIISNTSRANYALRGDLVKVMTCLLTDPADYRLPPLSPETLEAMENFECDLTEEMLDDLDRRFDHIFYETAAADVKKASPANSPRHIRDSIARQVIGQPEAVKAAALITYNHLAGRRTNAVFAGLSGCGKSEIWRCLSCKYPGLIRMVDFSRFVAEGWSGSLHLRDIFEGIDAASIRKRGLIVVLDEADKILCERAVSSSGTDHNALLQNDLLKMMDGDALEFGEENKKNPLSVDCSKVSIVMLGAFERLLTGKSQDAKHIGFGTASGAAAGGHKEISYDDLINGGMRREIAGRVNRIVALGPLSVDDYKSILMGPVLFDVQESFKRKVNIDSVAADAITGKAIGSGLGVRWMRSQVTNAVDDALFDEPEAEEYTVTMQDGKLLCRTQAGGEAAPVKKSQQRRRKAQGSTSRTTQNRPA